MGYTRHKDGTPRRKGLKKKCPQCGKWRYRHPTYAKRSIVCCSNLCRTRFYKKEKTSNWQNKGCMVRGYIRVRINNKPRFEHRVIMEQILGRKLRKSETIHHKNGLKWDNRKRNLELWATRGQHAGQRVSDLIKFVVKFYPEEVAEALLK